MILMFQEEIVITPRISEIPFPNSVKLAWSIFVASEYSEDTGKPVHTHSLIRAFTVCRNAILAVQQENQHCGLCVKY